MAVKVCAVCGKEIDTVKDGYVTCRDNFLQVMYFEEVDRSDNVFCSQECACELLMIEHVYDENPDREADVKGCSGECDFCPDAGDCEQCGSV
ncbi:MAG: hypothetical protein LBN31_07610 [Hungatella sp.]|jgi:hypothetical protein|nr:hypothetical protein [Hungatella sp.]